MLDWTLLKSFLLTIDTGSLSAAAQASGTTQPTLSRHIKQLEMEIGAPLFRRSVRGLEPTEAALILVDDAREMGRAAEALVLKASGRATNLTGTVRLTASVIVSNLILPKILTELRQAEPLIQIEIVASDASQNLLRRDADIALRMFDPTQSALIARKLGETPLGLYAAQDYLIRRGHPKELTDLLHHDVIGFDRADDMIKGYAAHGFPVSRNAFPLRCDDQMVCWNLLKAGAGLGFAQQLLGDLEPGLERIEVGMKLPALPVWIVMHEEVRNNARIRRVADFVATAMVARLTH